MRKRGPDLGPLMRDQVDEPTLNEQVARARGWTHDHNGWAHPEYVFYIGQKKYPKYYRSLPYDPEHDPRHWTVLLEEMREGKTRPELHGEHGFGWAVRWLNNSGRVKWQKGPAIGAAACKAWLKWQEGRR